MTPIVKLAAASLTATLLVASPAAAHETPEPDCEDETHAVVSHRNDWPMATTYVAWHLDTDCVVEPADVSEIDGQEVTVLGGTKAVPESAVEGLIVARRLWGADRIATARAVLDWIESGDADVAEPPETGTGITVSPTALGYGQDCLATTGCSLGFFGVPYDSVLVVGEDIAPGIWNSDVETVYDDGSCHAARLRRSVTRHPEFSASAWSFWELDLLWLEQPSGNLEPHGSVIQKRSTSYVYGPQSFSIEVAPTDYALIINSECR